MNLDLNVDVNKTKIFDFSYEYLLGHGMARILHQHEAVERLGVILYFHKERMKKWNAEGCPSVVNALKTAPVFILGGTGSGKTHLVKELCKLSELNFISINTSMLSNTGWKGYTLETVGTQLLKQANNNKDVAEWSVVFFDEFDKLFMTTNDHYDSYKRALAVELLTVIEGTGPFPIGDKDTMRSENMLFILGGSFGMHKENSATSIGFLSDTKQGNIIPTEHLGLLDMGFMPELAGRIGQMIRLEALNMEQLIDVFKRSPSSPFFMLKQELRRRYIDLHMPNDYVQRLIEENQENIEQFGVRGLYQVFNSLPYTHEILHEVALKKGVIEYVIDVDGLFRAYKESERVFQNGNVDD